MRGRGVGPPGPKFGGSEADTGSFGPVNGPLMGDVGVSVQNIC